MKSFCLIVTLTKLTAQGTSESKDDGIKGKKISLT
jgi:hypothetical protein